MATAANVAAAATTTSSNSQNTPASQTNGVNRNSTRSSSSVKTGDSAQRQSPMDNTSRPNRAPSQKAWTSGTNPLTQRGPPSSQPNGSASQMKNSVSTKPTMAKENGMSDKHAHDRLIFLLGGALGLNLVLTTKAGDKYDGILSGSTLNTNSSKITLKMTKKTHSSSTSQSDGGLSREAAFTGSSPEFAMNFDLRDMTDIVISDFSLPEAGKIINGASSSFQTDTDISGTQSRGERTLQKWIPDGPDSADFSLESGTTGGWDQFATNDQLFGTKSTYDETIYTTTIDRSAPSYKRREAEAARIAREIEGSSSTNAHMREERGHAVENDADDEEDKYSGVRRDNRTLSPLPMGSANKYTPPARRAPTAQPTVAGAPFDSAIISAQLSRPDVPKSSSSNSTREKASGGTNMDGGSGSPQHTTDALVDTPNGPASLVESVSDLSKVTGDDSQDQSARDRESDASTSPQRNVPAEVLKQFRAFAMVERTKLAERKKHQANQDLNAKLNEFRRFSKDFTLKTPIPSDLVGILAKDPAKQEAIIEKAQKQHAKSTSVTASPSGSVVPATTTSSAGVNAASTVVHPVLASNSTPPSASASITYPTPVRKFDASQIPPPIPDRQTLSRVRAGQLQAVGRADRSASHQQLPVGRGPSVSLPQRSAGPQPDKVHHPIPAPIPIVEGRIPPLAPLAEQAGLSSPQRSTLHTPTSAVSSKFNVRAMEFRPNATAATFNPAGSSNPPSSPSSIPRTSSIISRTASPASFFGARKPKAMSERPSLADYFNPVKRMKQETAMRIAGEKDAKTEDGPKEPRDYAFNGGIPNAFQTGPRWTVKDENSEKTYLLAFERPSATAVSPAQSRSGSSQHIPYQSQMPPLHGGQSTIPQISTPQHGNQGGPHHYPHQYDEGQARMQMSSGSPQIYPSASIASRQMSNYASPMNHPAQLAYGQQQYFGGPPGQITMQMRPYPGTPGMMHAQPGQMHAPMMVQQPSNGPYMSIPQQYPPQVQMYSPNPAHVYPQQNGYNSPGRMAPVMMQQNSQQGHHTAQPMMYTMSAQGGPMTFQQQAQLGMTRGGYGVPQYGSSPHQLYPIPQRTMSSGYGQMPQKMMPQQMPPGQGPPGNTAQSSGQYAPMDIGPDDGK